MLIPPPDEEPELPLELRLSVAEGLVSFEETGDVLPDLELETEPGVEFGLVRG